MTRVQDLFAEIVGRCPDAVAVTHCDEHLSYRELDEQSNRLARRLRRAGAGRQRLVGLCLERSLDLAVAVLGILKSGAAYVALDPSYPVNRLAYIFAHSRASLLVTQSSLAGRVASSSESTIVLDLERGAIEREPASAMLSDGEASDVAYVLYTSGSTGLPKGVAMEHGPLVNMLRWQLRESPEPLVSLQLAPLSFDVSFQEIFATWGNGGRLVMATETSRRDVLELWRLISAEGVQRVYLPFVALQQLAETATEIDVESLALCEVVSSGEQLEVTRHVRSLFTQLPGCLLRNHYGATEGHVVTSFTLSGDPERWPSRPSIGRPIDNVTLHVLNSEGQPVADTVTGELHVAGAAVGCEYLRDPERNAQRFPPDPFSDIPGARMYRTGDLGFRGADGNFEILGRIDQQVKLRGYRVELGGIEATAALHPLVGQAVVTVQEEGSGDRRLVLHYTCPGPSLEPVDLRRHLAEQLPAHEIPQQLVALEAFPRTPSGKLDRGALTVSTAGKSTGSSDSSSVENQTQARLAALWMGLLGSGPIGADDDFFDLGGHSLLATRLLSRVRDAFGRRIEFRHVLEAPTLRAMAALIDELDGEEQPRPIARSVPAGELTPLAPAQERLWIVESQRPGTSVHGVPLALRLRGRLDVDSLKSCLQSILERQGALRTSFEEVGGVRVQRVAPAWELELGLVELDVAGGEEREAVLAERLAEAADRPFDLREGPLLRTLLIRSGADDHVLLIDVHHSVTDGWSLDVLLHELAEGYEALIAGREPRLPELPIQYADYSRDQQARQDGQGLAREVAYWRDLLSAPLPVLDLPADRARPASMGFRGGDTVRELPEELLRALSVVGSSERASLQMVLLAAFKTLLHHYSGQDDLIVGTPVSGRDCPEVEGLIGFFVKTVPIRTRLEVERSFRELLVGVRESCLAAYEHAALPFEQLVATLKPERDASRTPVFQALFAYTDTSGRPSALGDLGLTIEHVPRRAAATDLTLFAERGRNGGRLVLEYNAEVFEAETARRMLRHFEVLLAGIVAEPDRALGTLSLVDSEELAQLRAWNDTRVELPATDSIPAAFSAQALLRPTARAVAMGESELTYGELDEASNRLAHRLIACGVGPEVPVAVSMERSPRLVVALLGILKAGGAYVPLDGAYPSERLQLMCEVSGAGHLVADAGRAPKLGGLEQVFELDEDLSTLAEQPTTAVGAALTGESLAYLMFTSGSTGTPMGVDVPHRAVLRLVLGTDYVRLDSSRVLLQAAPISFDAATFEIWGALLNGGCCFVSQDAVPHAAGLRELIERGGVTTAWLTASLFNAVVEDSPESLAGLEDLLVGGEALSVPHVRTFLARCPSVRLINGYGPTENTTFTTTHRVPSDLLPQASSVPIGSPIANTVVYVVNPLGVRLPVGVPGELQTAGLGLARGYRGQAERTAERFVPDPFGEGESDLMYRTGDRVRLLSDGSLEFLGRLDDQVKIRGHRIEPGEVETALLSCEGVAAACVMAREAGPGDVVLVAYVVPASGASLDLQALRRRLAEELPAYLVPNRFVELGSLPVTPNGKVDRKALPSPTHAHEERHARAGDERVMPIEEVLQDIWAELLSIPKPGVHEDFFELGGQSLQALQVVDRAGLHGLQLSPTALIRHPTIAGLAAAARVRLLDSSAEGARSLVALHEEGTGPPLYFLHFAPGDLLGYGSLVRSLGADQPCYGFQSLGLADPSLRHRDIESMAAQYLRELVAFQPSGPYHLVGWCFGGTVALELARQLLEAGHEVGLVGLIEAEPTESRFSARYLLRRLGLLLRKGRGVFRYFREKARAATEAEDDPFLEVSAGPLAHRRKVYETNRRAAKRHRTRSYPGHVVLFRAANQEGRLIEADGGWHRFAGSLELRSLEGGHESVMRPPGVDDLARGLRELLSDAE